MTGARQSATLCPDERTGTRSGTPRSTSLRDLGGRAPPGGVARHPQRPSGRPASPSPVGLRGRAGAAVQPGPERQAWHDDVRAPFTTTVVGAPLSPESRIWYRAQEITGDWLGYRLRGPGT